MKLYKSTKEFLEGRDAALISGDIQQMREHLIRAGDTSAKKAKAEVIEMSIHKSRIHWRGCPADKLKESVWWLLDRGLHLDIM